MNQCDTPEIPLLAYDAALDELISHLSTVPGVSEKPLMQALGEVLAETQQASINVPSADNSAMDGYAFNTADLTADGATVLPVSQRIAAGHSGVKLQAGTAARIFTGAPIPEGANAVIMQEQVESRK